MKRPITRSELMDIPIDLDWNKQLGMSFRRHTDFHDLLENVEDVDPSIYHQFDMRVSPYTAQLMHPSDKNDPIRLQYMPSNAELARNFEMADSLGEDDDMHEGSTVVHRYPHRVLFLVAPTCSSLCRFCTRKRFVGHAERAPHKDEIQEGIDYIAANSHINDVLLSGGDPLILPDKRLDDILGRLRAAAPNIRLLRIGSRLPVQVPSRITDEFINVMVKHDVNLLNVHVNHPKEITPYFQKQMRKLSKSGIMLGNQSVLMKGVNDDAAILTELNMRLLECHVKPYYVYTTDVVSGNSQWYVPYKRTLEIIEQMRGWNSGPSMPTFVLDAPNGGGKLPIQPDYVTVGPSGEVFWRNYEGKTGRAHHLEEGFQ